MGDQQRALKNDLGGLMRALRVGALTAFVFSIGEAQAVVESVQTICNKMVVLD